MSIIASRVTLLDKRRRGYWGEQFTWCENVNKPIATSRSDLKHRRAEASSSEKEVPTLSKLYKGLIWVDSCWVRWRQTLASSITARLTRLKRLLKITFRERQIGQTSDKLARLATNWPDERQIGQTSDKLARRVTNWSDEWEIGPTRDKLSRRVTNWSDNWQISYTRIIAWVTFWSVLSITVKSYFLKILHFRIM